MNRQTSLLEKPRYCIDTNVIVSFMKKTENEFYGSDVFKPQWEFLEDLIARGIIIAPKQVEIELLAWCDVIPEMAVWLKQHKYMFVDVEEDEQLVSAKRILKEYSIYGTTKNYLGDLAVITLADSMKITVISLESETQTPSKRRPKIPNICKEFDIDAVSFSGFLRREKFGSKSNS
ncbi:MAG: DUF4411 family protein [Candidatus Saccharibacteria bacterium]|nr:DUF4411 family protein [Candidatus Saccharibacteria bacterium]